MDEIELTGGTDSEEESINQGEEEEKKQVCRDHQRGNCRRGKTCPFVHIDPVSNGPPSSINTKPPRNKQVCRDFGRGHCPRGPRCMYLHERELCRAYARGECTRKDCPYEHRIEGKSPSPRSSSLSRDRDRSPFRGSSPPRKRMRYEHTTSSGKIISERELDYLLSLKSEIISLREDNRYLREDNRELRREIDTLRGTTSTKYTGRKRSPANRY